MLADAVARDVRQLTLFGEGGVERALIDGR